MPPRIQHFQSLVRRARTGTHELQSITVSIPSRTRSMASAAAVAAVSSAPTPAMLQPPSHRRPEYRKSQLHRQYASILRTMPLIIYFQHNNLQATEWANIRRELVKALRKVDAEKAAAGSSEPAIADVVKLQIIQNSIYEAAMRVVDYYRPESTGSMAAEEPITDKQDARLTHDLSYAAYKAVLPKRGKHDFSTLLVGPIATLSFPSVSPDHLRAAFSILAPTGKDGLFPAPPRKTNPGLYDLTTQFGLQKLMMLGARVDGKLFDIDEARWVGSIEGGIGGLRARLVSMLQGASANLARTLESAGNNVYITLESRRSVMEEEQNGGKKDESAEEK